MSIQTSVIIQTRNRSSERVSCLASLAQQSLAADTFEVIVGDNASEDATKEVVTRALGASPKHNIRYIFEEVPGLLSGRHRGAIAASGAIPVVIHGHIQVYQGWLGAIRNS